MAAGNTLEQTVVIGDTMETDIRGAVEAGLQAYLVLTGSTQVENVCEYVYQPTRVLESVGDLVEELKTGKPSNRLDSPALRNTRNLRWGRRYQTDDEHLSKPRPAAARRGARPVARATERAS
jgi:NagD protein